MLALLLGQVPQELPDARVGGLPRGGLVKPSRLQFHQLGFFADRGQPEGAHQPDWLAVDEPFDIMSSDQRDVLTELLAVQLDEPVPVPILLAAHLVEDCGCGGVVSLEPLRKVAVNAGIFFFEGNGQGQNLLLAEALKGSHGVRLSQVPRCEMQLT